MNNTIIYISHEGGNLLIKTSKRYNPNVQLHRTRGGLKGPCNNMIFYHRKKVIKRYFLNNNSKFYNKKNFELFIIGKMIRNNKSLIKGNISFIIRLLLLLNIVLFFITFCLDNILIETCFAEDDEEYKSDWFDQLMADRGWKGWLIFSFVITWPFFGVTLAKVLQIAHEVNEKTGGNGPLPPASV